MFPIKTFERNIRKALLEPGYAVKALVKRARASASYRFDKSGKAPLPESITFFLTYRCNLRCKMCGQWGDEGANKSFDPAKINAKLDLSSYTKLLDEVKAFKPHITLFGGEPLMYDEFDELVQEIKKRRLHLGIITNGTLVKKHANTIVSTGVDVVSLSVDGSAELQDKVRNLKGAFARIKEGADEIMRLRKEKKTAKPVINIVCTISDLNYKSIKEMPEVAKELHADTLNLHHLIFTEGETVENHNKHFKEKFGAESRDWTGFIRPSVKGMDIAALVRDLSDLKAGKYPFLLTVYPDFSKEESVEYYTSKDFISNEYPKRCLSPWVVAYVYPNGEVLPCHSLGFAAGNINDEPFLKIWNGEKMRSFRRELKAEKYFKVCPKCTEMYRY
ncbi:MAG: radical SAM protein [Candidatus Firestonebacteria bacterium]